MKIKEKSSPRKVTPKTIIGQNKGQLILEYILLIFVVAAAAVLLSKSLVGRGEGEEGVIITKWAQLLQMVGQDLGD